MQLIDNNVDDGFKKNQDIVSNESWSEVFLWRTDAILYQINSSLIENRPHKIHFFIT